MSKYKVILAEAGQDSRLGGWTVSEGEQFYPDIKTIKDIISGQDKHYFELVTSRMTAIFINGQRYTSDYQLHSIMDEGCSRIGFKCFISAPAFPESLLLSSDYDVILGSRQIGKYNGTENNKDYLGEHFSLNGKSDYWDDGSTQEVTESDLRERLL